MLKCKDVPAEAERLLDGTLTFGRRLSLRVHILICSHCRRFVRQLRQLLRAIPFMHGRASDAQVQAVMDALERKRTERQ